MLAFLEIYIVLVSTADVFLHFWTNLTVNLNENHLFLILLAYVVHFFLAQKTDRLPL